MKKNRKKIISVYLTTGIDKAMGKGHRKIAKWFFNGKGHKLAGP